MGRQVVIIGGGATGTSAFMQLVRTAKADSIRVVDPNPPGMGLAFGTSHSEMLCNTSVSVTSLVSHDDDDLLNYLRAQGWTYQPDDFVPRFLVAQYSRQRFLEHERLAARRGVLTEHLPHKALSIEVAPGPEYRVHLSNGDVVNASDVLVCVGVEQPVTPQLFVPFTDHPRYVPSPYPAQRMLRRVGTGADVLVVGTRLSAIDAALLLTRTGNKVVLTSPSGELPAVRTRLRRPLRPMVSKPGFTGLSARDPLLDHKLARVVLTAIRRVHPLPLRYQVAPAQGAQHRLRKETLLAESCHIHWQDIVSDVIDGLNDWLPALGHADRDAVMERCRHHVNRYISAIPLDRAHTLLREMDSGRIEVSAGYPERVRTGADNRWQVDWPGGGTDRFDVVVGASGYRKPRIHHEGQTVYLDGPSTPRRSPVQVSGDLRLVLDSPRAERIWLIGSSSHVRMPIVNYLSTAVRQAGAVAAQLG